MENSKIAIKTSRGLEILKIDDIICCIAKGRYTTIISKSGKEYLLSKVLKEIEECLPSEYFFRTHKSYLINLNHIVYYQNNREMPITLVNDVKVLLAKRKKQEFQFRIREIAQTI